MSARSITADDLIAYIDSQREIDVYAKCVSCGRVCWRWMTDPLRAELKRVQTRTMERDQTPLAGSGRGDHADHQGVWETTGTA